MHIVSKGLMTVKDLWNGACSCPTKPATTASAVRLLMIIYNNLSYNEKENMLLAPAILDMLSKGILS